MLKCSKCDSFFSGEKELKSHSTCHAGDEGSECFQCGVCSSSFEDRDRLETHMSVHSAPKSHECPECQESFHRLEDLKNHMLNHARPDENRTLNGSAQDKNRTLDHSEPNVTFECSRCDATFKKRSSLRTHIIICHAKRLL